MTKKKNGKYIEAHCISYYKNGQLHREDGPALEYDNGYQKWYLNGLRHRANNLPAVIYKNNDQEYWLNGKQHRDNGPAVIYDKHYEYWIHGVEYTKEEFDFLILEKNKLKDHLDNDLEENNSQSIKLKI